MKYADEVIEFWGETFTANPNLLAAGVTFEHFIAAPWGYLAAHRGHVPLLPAQAAVRSRLDARDSARYTIRDGALVERLHHRTWPRRQDRRVAKVVA